MLRCVDAPFCWSKWRFLPFNLEANQSAGDEMQAFELCHGDDWKIPQGLMFSWGYTYGHFWWFDTFFDFPYIGNVIMPMNINELIFFRGLETTCQFSHGPFSGSWGVSKLSSLFSSAWSVASNAVIALIHGWFVPKSSMLCTFAGCGRENRLLSLAHSFGLVDRIEWAQKKLKIDRGWQISSAERNRSSPGASKHDQHSWDRRGPERNLYHPVRMDGLAKNGWVCELLIIYIHVYTFHLPAIERCYQQRVADSGRFLMHLQSWMAHGKPHGLSSKILGP